MSIEGLGTVWLAVLAVLFLAQCCGFGIAGGLLLSPVDRSEAGFMLGFFLGPVGLVIAWAMRANGLLELERKEQRQLTAPPQSSAHPPAPRRPSEPRRFK